MKRVLNIILFQLISVGLIGQSISQRDTIEVNNIGFAAYSNGWMLYDTNLIQGSFEILNDSGLFVFYDFDLWISGIRSGTGDSVITHQFYHLPHCIQSEGPIANNYFSSNYSKYKRIWKIKKSTVDFHRNNFKKLWYVAPNIIKDWPAHGDTTNGELYNLAPYVDYNKNGRYDPQNGDYPCIKGDEAMYLIYNDHTNIMQCTGSNPFPLEIHCMIYGYKTSDARNNTIFVEYDVRNRSKDIFTDMRFGLWADMAIGLPDNDYIGCDSNLNLFFNYGATQKSQGTAGIVVLNRKLNSFISFARGPGPFGDPFYKKDFFNYLNSRWKDGTHLVYGGQGKVTDPRATNIPTKYMFPGEVDDTSQWNETSVGNPPFDRRGLGTTGPFTLYSGNSVKLDLAFLYAIDTSLNSFQDVYHFKNEAKVVRSWYKNNHPSCSNWITSVVDIENENTLKAFPNPVADELSIVIEERVLNQSIRIYDVYGRMKWEGIPDQDRIQIDVGSWTKGVYIIQYEGESSRIVVE